MSHAIVGRTRGPRVLGVALAIALLAALFVVVAAPARAEMTVTVVLDKASYLSGDTATATAIVYRTPGPVNYTYSWEVSELFGGTLLSVLSGNVTLDYDIPLDFQGTLVFTATIDDGTTQVTDSQIAGVEIAYMSLTLDRADFNPGDIITAYYGVSSHVIMTPQYDYEVEDSAGTVVLAGNTAVAQFSFDSPDPASPWYIFRVVASQDGNSTQIEATIYQASGAVLGVTMDKTSYAPGETVRLHLSVTPRGTTALPSQFRWTVSFALFGQAASATTTSPVTDFSILVPQSMGSGDLVLLVAELNTGATAILAVRVGPTNPVWSTEIGGIPVFALILTLLFVLLLIGLAALWRRVGGGRGPAPMPPGAAGPAPPPEPPRRGPTIPMAVACKHCGKTIDLTTSKRPIEVMCPSCGETQLVT
jgi:hypothetical protein